MASLHGCVKPCFFAFSRAFIKHTQKFTKVTGKCIPPENQNCSHIHVRKPYEDSMFAYNSYFDSI